MVYSEAMERTRPVRMGVVPRRPDVSKVLIVDDEPHLRLLYETELRRAGFETLTAGTAAQGLEYVQTMKPDLVILDIRMPGMDGIEALQHILDRDTRIPVVLNTAFSSYRDNYLTWAADAYVTKSADVTELVETVKSVLDSRLASRS